MFSVKGMFSVLVGQEIFRVDKISVDIVMFNAAFLRIQSIDKSEGASDGSVLVAASNEDFGAVEIVRQELEVLNVSLSHFFAKEELLGKTQNSQFSLFFGVLAGKEFEIVGRTSPVTSKMDNLDELCVETGEKDEKGSKNDGGVH